MIDRRTMRHDTDIGAPDRRWFLMCQLCAGMLSPAGPSDMLFTRYGDEEAHMRRLYSLFRRYCDR